MIGTIDTGQLIVDSRREQHCPGFDGGRVGELQGDVAICSRVGNPWNSSTVAFRYVASSMTMTSRRARASTRAAVNPAAPPPITTTAAQKDVYT
jgi:hypothetical protein